MLIEEVVDGASAVLIEPFRDAYGFREGDVVTIGTRETLLNELSWEKYRDLKKFGEVPPKVEERLMVWVFNDKYQREPCFLRRLAVGKSRQLELFE